jgi:hypothetical protein
MHGLAILLSIGFCRYPDHVLGWDVIAGIVLFHFASRRGALDASSTRYARERAESVSWQISAPSRARMLLRQLRLHGSCFVVDSQAFAR